MAAIAGAFWPSTLVAISAAKALRLAAIRAGGTVIASAVSYALAAVFVWAGVASAAPGSIELCKDGGSGQQFAFTLTSGAKSLSQTVTGLLCLVFEGLCVNSFVQVRRRRRAKEELPTP